MRKIIFWLAQWNLNFSTRRREGAELNRETHEAREISKQKSERFPVRFGLEKRFDQAATSLRRGCTTLRAPLPLAFWLRMNVTYGLESFKP